MGQQSKFLFTQSLWNSLNIPNVIINTCHLLLPQILKPMLLPNYTLFLYRSIWNHFLMFLLLSGGYIAY